VKLSLPLAAVLLVLAWMAPAWSQGSSAAAPEVRSMVEALTPNTQRSMRNLVVRQKTEAEAASAPAAGTAVASAPAAVAVNSPVAPQAIAAAPLAVPVAAATAAPPGPPPSLSLAIQFETNSAQVRPESGHVLGNLVAAMQSPDLKGVRFAIEGHTDARGPASVNQQLSLQRADEVRLYLIALGVHPARLRAVGKGSSDLANPLDPAAAENRRVRVVTLE
jgi:outer membrane protein OmpA-like peptidoglycan-associated protein